MRSTLHHSALFALVAFALVLVIDAILSFAVQPPPPQEHRTAFFVAHGVFHAGVLCLSAIGAWVGFALIRGHLPTVRQNVVLAVVFGFLTVLAGPGSFMLAGPIGAATWLLLGSLAVALCAAVFHKPWRRQQHG